MSVNVRYLHFRVFISKRFEQYAHGAEELRPVTRHPKFKTEVKTRQNEARMNWNLGMLHIRNNGYVPIRTQMQIHS